MSDEIAAKPVSKRYLHLGQIDKIRRVFPVGFEELPDVKLLFIRLMIQC